MNITRVAPVRTFEPSVAVGHRSQLEVEHFMANHWLHCPPRGSPSISVSVGCPGLASPSCSL